MAVSLLVRMKVQPGKNDIFEKTFSELAAKVRANEPGNIFYCCHRTDDPTEYIIMEQYIDDEAIKAHGASEHFQAHIGDLRAVLDGAADLQRLRTIDD